MQDRDTKIFGYRYNKCTKDKEDIRNMNKSEERTLSNSKNRFYHKKKPNKAYFTLMFSIEIKYRSIQVGI